MLSLIHFIKLMEFSSITIVIRGLMDVGCFPFLFHVLIFYIQFTSSFTVCMYVYVYVYIYIYFFFKFCASLFRTASKIFQKIFEVGVFAFFIHFRRKALSLSPFIFMPVVGGFIGGTHNVEEVYFSS